IGRGGRPAGRGSLEAAVGALAAVVIEGEVGARVRAVRALAELGGAAAQAVLMSALRDAGAEVRAEAVRALVTVAGGRPGPSRAVAGVLRRAVHDPHETVAAAAREGLASLGAEGGGGGARA